MTSRRIIRIRQNQVYQNRFLELYDDEVRFPSGQTGNYLRLNWNFPYSVGVVPVTINGKVLLIRQFCYAANDYVVQIPKGMGEAGLHPVESAARELREELGGAAKSLELLGNMMIDPGLIENPLFVFLGLGVETDSSSEQPEFSEVIDGIVELDPASDQFVHETRKLNDAVTIASLMLAREQLR